MAKASCSYDLDPVDEAWLNLLNGERTMAGSLAVTEEQFERVIEELEVRSIYYCNYYFRTYFFIFYRVILRLLFIGIRLCVGIKFKLLSKLRRDWALNMMKM